MLAASTSYGAPSKPIRSFTVMTQNLYLGADTSPLFTATTPAQFFTAVGAAYNRVQATNFSERADSIADEIMEAKPDLIGLQEASLFRTQVPADGPATPATNVAFDYIEILLDKLDERGLNYEVAVVQTGSDIEVPGLFTTGLMDVRLTDRDAILVNADLTDITIVNAQSAQFAARLSLTTVVGPVSLPTSWVSVDATLDNGKTVRFISTHLEPLSPAIQLLQSNELLNGPGNTALPTVFMGDFNSNADGTGTPTYANLIGAGLKDSWTLVGEGNGFTCCQDDELLNPDSSLTRRIDLVLLHGGVKAQAADVKGDTQDDRTSSGLWPSDHAGLATKLKLTK